MVNGGWETFWYVTPAFPIYINRLAFHTGFAQPCNSFYLFLDSNSNAWGPLKYVSN